MERYILDTHALIWWWTDDARLSARARATMADREKSIEVPSICALEIANKVRIGKLPEMAAFIGNYDGLLSTDGFGHLDLGYRHALLAGNLPGDHRDPFDRLIAAQALLDDLVIITSDREFTNFGCKVLW